MPAASLPILMYHYVSRFTGPINVTPENFEAQCRGMAARGWRGIGLDEAAAIFTTVTETAPQVIAAWTGLCEVERQRKHIKRWR